MAFELSILNFAFVPISDDEEGRNDARMNMEDEEEMGEGEEEEEAGDGKEEDEEELGDAERE